MNTSNTKRKFDPLSIFPNNTKAARFWFFIAAVLGILAVGQPYLIIEAMKTKERIVIMDEAGIFHIAPLYKFEDAAPMHDYLVSVATSALLSRGPKGADNPPLLKQIFLEEAYAKIEKFHLLEAGQFAKKKLHQKIETKSIKVLKTGDKTVLAKVKGQLIRVGTFEGRTFTDVKDFVLQLTLYRNPRMSANGRLPMAVLDWKISIRDHQTENEQGEQL
jgi:hypothetical protein